MTDLIFEQLKETMEGHVQSLEKAFNKVRTGRASVALLDGIKVDYYGTPTPLNQIATLSTPESQLILISPWDKGAIDAIGKAIQKSELGLVPNSDGKVIRISIPPLTEERRKELVKVVRKMTEEYKVRLRNARRDANADLKKLKTDGDISEDNMHDCQEKVQKTTDDYIEKMTDRLTAKEAEIMEV